MTRLVKSSPPVFYSKELAKKILERVAAGEFVLAILREPGMPSHGSIANWRARHPEFEEAYRTARQSQAQVHAERGMAIAMNEDPKWRNKDPSDRRLAFNAMQWSAAKLDPKNWGDKTVLSGDPDAPLLIEARKREQMAALTYDERKKIEAILLAAASRQDGREIEGEASQEEDGDE